MGYENGKIYAIRSHQTDDIYIGSTTQPLYKRFSSHKANFKDKSYRYVSVNELLKYDDVYIELLQGYCCDNKMELLKREGEFIRSMDCVNKRVAGRTHKEHYEDNKDKIKEQVKAYSEAHKEERHKRVICECGGKYQKKHKTDHFKTKKHINHFQ